MAHVSAAPCIGVKDKACVEVCPVDCIYEGPNQLFIHPDECIDCGACEPVCPWTAILVCVAEYSHGWTDPALRPPRRWLRWRGLGAGLPGDGDLRRGRDAGAVETLQ